MRENIAYGVMDRKMKDLLERPEERMGRSGQVIMVSKIHKGAHYEIWCCFG